MAAALLIAFSLRGVGSVTIYLHWPSAVDSHVEILSLPLWCCAVGLGALLTLDLDSASQRDAAVCELLSGKAASRLVVMSTQLLTETHSAVLRAVKVLLILQQLQPNPEL